MTGQSPWIPQIDSVRCTGCGDCIMVCPTGALGKKGDKAVVQQPCACTYCGACEEICTPGALELPYQIVFSLDPLNSHTERHR